MNAPTSRILVGDVRAMLASLPDGSVDTVITSPPYWGLRAYQTEPQIWGGDPNCPHRWETERTKRGNGSGGTGKASAKQTTNAGAFVTDTQDRATYSDTCALCGAWRGELGAEPTIALYVAHLVEIFALIHRKLAPWGTV